MIAARLLHVVDVSELLGAAIGASTVIGLITIAIDEKAANVKV